jgi:hypothetical protein
MFHVHFAMSVQSSVPNCPSRVRVAPFNCTPVVKSRANSNITPYSTPVLNHSEFAIQTTECLPSRWRVKARRRRTASVKTWRSAREATAAGGKVATGETRGRSLLNVRCH